MKNPHQIFPPGLWLIISSGSINVGNLTIYSLDHLCFLNASTNDHVVIFILLEMQNRIHPLKAHLRQNLGTSCYHCNPECTTELLPKLYNFLKKQLVFCYWYIAVFIGVSNSLDRWWWRQIVIHNVSLHLSARTPFN